MFQLDVSDAYTSVPQKRAVLAVYELIKQTEKEDKNRAWHLPLFTANWITNRPVYFQKACMIIESGIIQGGPFSPPLFLVYLSYQTIDGKRCLVMKFADDCGMLMCSPTAEGLRILAENALKDFSEWLKSKGMECAEHKSKFMLMFRTKKTAEKHFKNLIPPSEQNPDPLVQAMRILGIMVDAALKFREHVSNVCNSFRTRINSL